METDSLKTLWNEILEAGIQPLAGEQISLAKDKNIHTLTEKVKRNLLLEGTAAVVCLVLAIVAAVLFHTLVVYVFAVAVVACSCLFCAYISALYKRIRFYETGIFNTRMQLEMLVDILKRFTRLYWQLSIFLLPVIFVFGLMTGFFDVLRNGWSTNFQWTRGFLVYFVAFFCWAIFIYFFTRAYIRKLYGNHLTQLQSILKDMENG